MGREGEKEGGKEGGREGGREEGQGRPERQANECERKRRQTKDTTTHCLHAGQIPRYPTLDERSPVALRLQIYPVYPLVPGVAFHISNLRGDLK